MYKLFHTPCEPGYYQTKAAAPNEDQIRSISRDGKTEICSRIRKLSGKYQIIQGTKSVLVTTGLI
jgi:hypothetical protein